MNTDSRILRSLPEDQGVSSSGILAFIEAVERQDEWKRNRELHGFMLIRHGYVVAEGWWSPYVPERPHMLFSLSKSYTSTAVGLAVSEGLLSIEDSVISFFLDDTPKDIGENLASMRVRHLLSMSTGHALDTMDYLYGQKEGNWIRGFFNAPVDFEPGTHFVYNTGATYMLSAIIQKLTGQKLIDYLKPRLFEPLGIENAVWETCPRGINTGGFGLSIRTADIACFGQLYLQKGNWNGKQIIPKSWVEEATASHIYNGQNPSADWEQGYGYQFWRCRNNAYRGDGAFGQYCVVMPDQDAVLAINSGLNDMQAVLNLVWDCLLPAMNDRLLPADTAAQDALRDKLQSLELEMPEGKKYDAVISEVSGERFILEENTMGVKDITFSFNDDKCIIVLNYEISSATINCGIGRWLEGEAWLEGKFLLQGRMMRAATCGMWSDTGIFKMYMRFIEAPFCVTMTCRFEGELLFFETDLNVSFDAETHKSIMGHK